jgi:hypothetical protein
MFAGASVTQSPNFNEADVSDKPAFIRAHGLVDASQMVSQRRREWAGAVSVDDVIRSINQTLMDTASTTTPSRSS